ncbi:hypothetical protein [Paraflavitalea pollutisoli]|uniref:hypothetical protein n=1 Tax=Paraflavitalea pollutisoli TaxID=3034143 RepID=UPI0023EC2550|nr:hypothetical protein [Paraflavitalea sp. H1-2-19X]
MAPESIEYSSIEQQREHVAEALPHPPVPLALPEKDKRITAHDLFTFFTATIIVQKETFVR